jgi:hypothetical protein
MDRRLNATGSDPEEAQGRFTLFGFRDFANSVDQWITTSRFGRIFRLSGTGHVSGTYPQQHNEEP